VVSAPAIRCRDGHPPTASCAVLPERCAEWTPSAENCRPGDKECSRSALRGVIASWPASARPAPQLAGCRLSRSSLLVLFLHPGFQHQAQTAPLASAATAPLSCNRPLGHGCRSRFGLLQGRTPPPPPTAGVAIPVRPKAPPMRRRQASTTEVEPPAGPEVTGTRASPPPPPGRWHRRLLFDRPSVPDVLHGTGRWQLQDLPPPRPYLTLSALTESSLTRFTRRRIRADACLHHHAQGRGHSRRGGDCPASTSVVGQGLFAVVAARPWNGASSRNRPQQNDPPELWPNQVNLARGECAARSSHRGGHPIEKSSPNEARNTDQQATHSLTTATSRTGCPLNCSSFVAIGA